MNRAYNMPDQYSKLVGDTLKYPYLVGISTDSGNFGTGILISPRLVLTCAHVLHDCTSVEVISHEGSTSARAQKVDDSLDLALLELTHPLSAPKAKFTDFPLQPGAVLRAVGVQATPGKPGELSVAEIKLPYQNQNEAGGKILDMQLEGGARPGYSGGPVVVEEGGDLRCVGILRLGGSGAGTTIALGMASIRAFLADYITDIPEDKLGTNAAGIRRPLILTGILFGVVIVAAIVKWPYQASHSPEVARGTVIVTPQEPAKTASGQLAPPEESSVQTPAGPGKVDQENPGVKVWVSTSSKLKVYHCPETRWYGRTQHGEYMTQADAQKKGYRAANWKVCK